MSAELVTWAFEALEKTAPRVACEHRPVANRYYPSTCPISRELALEALVCNTRSVGGQLLVIRIGPPDDRHEAQTGDAMRRSRH